MSEHTVKAFDRELHAISREIVEMGELVARQLESATESVAQHDAENVRRIVAADLEIDRRQHEIEELVVLTIARRQPVAIDLRESIGALRIVSGLERMGDYAKNIAKRFVATGLGVPPAALLSGFQQSSELARAALREVIDAYARRDVELALSVWRADQAIDEKTNVLMRELMAEMTRDARLIPCCTQLLFCVKNIERFGDHATNIAETVYYIVSGKLPDEERPKG